VRAQEENALALQFATADAGVAATCGSAPSPRKIYLATSYAEKDHVKNLGAMWDADRKEWYITGDIEPEPFARWLQPWVKLNVPFHEKDAARDLGAKWDGTVWKVAPTMALDPFARWLPEGPRSEPGAATSAEKPVPPSHMPEAAVQSEAEPPSSPHA